MAILDQPYTHAHRKLRRKLERYKWSLAELRWLAAQEDGTWPRSLSSLVHTKLAEAEKEAHHAPAENLVLFHE